MFALFLLFNQDMNIIEREFIECFLPLLVPLLFICSLAHSFFALQVVYYISIFHSQSLSIKTGDGILFGLIDSSQGYPHSGRSISGAGKGMSFSSFLTLSLSLFHLLGYSLYNCLSFSVFSIIHSFRWRSMDA